MKILLLGKNGQLGHELLGPLSCVGEVDARSRNEVDLANLDALRRALDEARPSVVVNAAAHTDVDGAERDPEAARKVNRDAVALLGEEAKKRQFGLVHVSTDFVFDGEKRTPYVETDAPSPINAYGQSKLEGERALEEIDAPAIVLRTAWVYSLRRKSFVTAILRAAREREELRVVSDQIGNPTYCRDLAEAIALLVYGLRRDPHAQFAERRGVYHLAGEGEVSRYDFARAILELDPKREEHRARRIVPIASSDYPLPARRPAYSALSCAKFREAFGIRLPNWREALARAFAR